MASRVSWKDIQEAAAKGYVQDSDSDDNASSSVTMAAVANQQNRLLTVDASYSNPATSGLLLITIGASTYRKYIHGSGAFDFSVVQGLPAPVNTAITVTLAASGTAAIIGTLVLTGVRVPVS